MKHWYTLALGFGLAIVGCAPATVMQKLVVVREFLVVMSGNPISSGLYADPEGAIFGNRY